MERAASLLPGRQTRRRFAGCWRWRSRSPACHEITILSEPQSDEDEDEEEEDSEENEDEDEDEEEEDNGEDQEEEGEDVGGDETKHHKAMSA